MTKYLPLVSVALVVSGLIAFGQSRGGNWPTFGGDAQRSAWEGADTAITTESVKNLQLLWKIKLETQSRGARPVMPPVILGRLISYRGFKELAFVGANSDIVYGIDADLGTMFWQRHLEYSTREPQVMSSSWRCPGGLTAMPTMPISGRGGAAARGAPAQPAGQRGSPFIGGPASVYAVSSDGRLHRLNTSTGDDMAQPVSVIPANARATSLNMVDNVIYTVTSHECGGAPNAVWAIDVSVDPLKVRSFSLSGGTGIGLGGPVIGNDGTVYVQTGEATGLVALTARELQMKDYFTRERDVDGISLGDIVPAASPVVFAYNNRDLVVTPCGVVQICLLDSASLGGADHSTAMYRSPQIVQSRRNLGDIIERSTWGSISSWQEMGGTRWVLVSAMGSPHPDLKVPMTNGAATNGFVVAFKLQDQAGKVTLEPAWISRDMSSPLPPVIANGVVFGLSAGEFTRQLTKTSEDLNTIDERPKGSTRATLYALDAKTGKELYSSRNLVTGAASLTGMTVSNGRVYFGGLDGTLYALGFTWSTEDGVRLLVPQSA